MKKLISILLAGLMTISLIACNTEKKENDPSKNDEVQKEEIVEAYENVELATLADTLYDGLAEDERPMTMSMPLDAETFESFAFVPYEEGLEAVVNEPMIGSIAHSVVLVKCPTAEKAEAVAAAMKENCNPRKWVCVEADVVKAGVNKNIAMLLMTTTEGGMFETILKNFKKFDGKLPEVVTPDETVDEVIEEENTEENAEDGIVEENLFEDGSEEVDPIEAFNEMVERLETSEPKADEPAELD